MTISGPGTIDDLVHDAALVGYVVTRRLVHDWVSLGLLDKPQRRRTGPHGSEKALHSACQRRIFLMLLQARGETRRIPLLARIPLAVWMYGDNGCVPTRQALRALATHVGDPRGSRAQALETARWLTLPLDDSRLGTLRARREFLHCVRDALYTGSLDRERLLAKALPLFEPPELHREVVRSRGATAAATPETLIFELKIKLLAGSVVAAGDASEAHLEVVRELWNSLPSVKASDGGAHSLHSIDAQPTPQQIATCGSSILFGLGSLLIKQQSEETGPAPPR
ncbi:hypothetical protein GCM10010347_66210 [Streptomyces cirratus]|uniref:Uncharacterized protein n=1 Tax=Streptomyces cirratus TaxID=68187 RepID=A0ABQ3F5P6_9ACTN|nr:hypothetical protein GCM10010347_66210 [Streptomyces cirratus]